MNVLTMTDRRLAALFDECQTELRRRASTYHCDDLAIIRGNEAAKRALTVALAGNHTIVFVGPSNSGKSMFRAAAIYHAGPVTFEARPCPCGNHGSPIHECRCSVNQIQKHRERIPVADITIEVVPPSQRDLEGRPETTSAMVSAALADLPHHTDTTLGRDCATLLKASCAELSIDAKGRERIIAVARTIANLDRSPTIQPAHLCEAINYRAFRR